MDKSELFICTSSCPERAFDEQKHCIECNNGYVHKFVKEKGCCPVGNNPIWRKCDDLEL